MLLITDYTVKPRSPTESSSGNVWNWQRVTPGSIVGTPGAFVDGNTLHVFVIGVDGAPWDYSFVAGGTAWQRTKLVGNITGGISAVKFDSTLRFFTRGVDGSLIQFSYSGNVWNWQRVTPGSIVGTPGAFVDGNTLHVYVIGVDGAPWEYSLAAGGTAWQRTKLVGHLT